MPRRLALLAVVLCALAPTVLRALAGLPRPPPGGSPEGRGTPPRHWIGRAGDAGPRRELSGRERLLAGLPVDVNAATPEDLALVPGLSPRLAVAIVTERVRAGRFERVDELARVRGIGPARLARARPHLAIGP